MKKFLTFAAALLVGATLAIGATAHERLPSFKPFSDSHRATGTVLDSVPIYSAGSSTTRRVCKDVRVPIYAQTGGNTGDVVAGALIGGIAGKILTGKDAGAAVGAVVGGAAASQGQRVITGYRMERQCHDEVSDNSRLKYYETRIRLEGRIYRVRTSHQRAVGSTIRMYVHN